MENRSIKVMLLGMMILLVGGFILADPSSSLGGFEFFLMIAGLVIGMYGYSIKDNASPPKGDRSP